MNDVKPVKNVIKNLENFLEKVSVQKETLFHITYKAMHMSNRILLD